MRVAHAVPAIYDLTMNAEVTATVLKEHPRKLPYTYKNNTVLTVLRPSTHLFVIFAPSRFETIFGNYMQLISVMVERVERDLSDVFQREAGFVPQRYTRPSEGMSWDAFRSHYQEEALRIWWSFFAHDLNDIHFDSEGPYVYFGQGLETTSACWVGSCGWIVGSVIWCAKKTESREEAAKRGKEFERVGAALMNVLN